jgi:hypothetical protein
MVHGRLRTLQQLIDTLLAIAKKGNADTDRAVMCVTGER